MTQRILKAIMGLKRMIIVLSTYPDKKTALKCARSLVKRRLAACVNIVKIESSVYEWKGKLKEEGEFLLIIKARSRDYKKTESAIADRHPYEFPEIIRLPVEGGLRKYIDWVERR
jgi:periplasmic divalent cation tolerance protein